MKFGSGGLKSNKYHTANPCISFSVLIVCTLSWQPSRTNIFVVLVNNCTFKIGDAYLNVTFYLSNEESEQCIS